MIGTEQKLNQALKQQELLTDEMSHRTKNLFAIAGGMIRVSARSASTPAEMATILSGRLDALLAAHELARPSPGGDGAGAKHSELSELVRTILQPHLASDGIRLMIEGPPTTMGEQATRALSLVFHEFATNAAKYGALIDGGAVTVSCRNADGRLHLNWREKGGPRIDQAPTRNGFGAKLTRSTVVDQLGGTLDYAWRPHGLVIAMSIPIEKLDS